MTSIFRGRLFRVWLLLIAITLLSALIGGQGGLASNAGGAAITCAVLAIAFGKAWLVMFEFMEVRCAPVALRVMAGTWLIVALCALLASYFGLLEPVIRSV